MDDIFIGVPWWLALVLWIVLLPVIIGVFVIKLIIEIIDEGLRAANRPR
jgi:hypothetical protein